MGWIEGIGEAIRYIEENITEDLAVEKIAKLAFVSPFYFQKGFAMLCGLTVGEYIRQRRLTLAGSELASSNAKVIDIALKYGYESPDSFCKAFTRFHGVTPAAVRKGAVIKSFAPLKVKFLLEGGCIMDYRIEEKAPFTVLGVSKVFQYEGADENVPQFCAEYYQAGKGNLVGGTYGISIDENMDGNEFEYWIADDYKPATEIPDGFRVKVIPGNTWVIFPCKGAMPKALADIQQKIFSEWLPNCRDYEIAAGYNINMYGDPAEYSGGVQSENYYSEIWIPVQKKK